MDIFGNLFSKRVAYSPEDRKALRAHIKKYFGTPSKVLHNVCRGKVAVEYDIIPPTAERNYYTVITEGMGAVRMKVPKEYRRDGIGRAELLITLPPHWNLESEDIFWQWPLRLLAATAAFPFACRDWLWLGHTVGEEEGAGETAFAPNTALSAVMLDFPIAFGEESYECELNCGKVSFFRVLPLYPEELAFKFKYGAWALSKRIGNLADVIDPLRINAVTDPSFANIDDVMDAMSDHLEAIKKKNLGVDPQNALNHMAVFLRAATELGMLGSEFESAHREALFENGAPRSDLRRFIEQELGGELRLSFFDESYREFLKWYFNFNYPNSGHFYPEDVDEYAFNYFGEKQFNSEKFADEAYLFLPFDESFYLAMKKKIEENRKKFFEEEKRSPSGR